MNAYCYTFSFGNPEVMLCVVDWVKAACQCPVDQPEPGGQDHIPILYSFRGRAFSQFILLLMLKTFSTKRGKTSWEVIPWRELLVPPPTGEALVQAAAGIVRHAALSPPFVGCKAKQSSLQSLLKTHSCCLSSWVSCRSISHPHRESLQTWSLVQLLHHIPAEGEGIQPLSFFTSGSPSDGWVNPKSPGCSRSRCWHLPVFIPGFATWSQSWGEDRCTRNKQLWAVRKWPAVTGG